MKKHDITDNIPNIPSNDGNKAKLDVGAGQEDGLGARNGSTAIDREY